MTLLAKDPASLLRLHNYSVGLTEADINEVAKRAAVVELEEGTRPRRWGLSIRGRFQHFGTRFVGSRNRVMKSWGGTFGADSIRIVQSQQPLAEQVA